MQVEVRLYANLRKYAPGRDPVLLMELAEGALVSDLLRTLRIGEDVEVVLLVNGRPGKREGALREGDRIVMFPPVAGG
jgi:molybdopterin synthase sulfur carrier subunit